ncbi:hypothetical protein BWZ43_25445, partial [Heyndrickxia oleronia]
HTELILMTKSFIWIHGEKTPKVIVMLLLFNNLGPIRFIIEPTMQAGGRVMFNLCSTIGSV